MKYATKQDADIAATTYRNWQGVYYGSNKTPIKAIFTGTNDPILSKDIWRGIEGTFAEIPFNEYDLNNLELWVAFGNNEIMRVEDVLADDFMKSILPVGALRHELTITENWSNPLPIPNGLHVLILFEQESSITFKVMNNKNETIGFERTIQRHEGGRYNISYHDLQHLDLSVTDRVISLKLSDSSTISRQITVAFVQMF